MQVHWSTSNGPTSTANANKERTELHKHISDNKATKKAQLAMYTKKASTLIYLISITVSSGLGRGGAV